MKLVIISGRSGSGKSTALHLLEDEGYTCIDNLPVALLPQLIEEMRPTDDGQPQQVAICIDARNTARHLAQFDGLLQQLADDVTTDIIYLDADEATLIKRFSETRRRHPLSNHGASLAEAIQQERALLEPIALRASLTLDTSNMTLHDLRREIRERLVGHEGAGLSLLFQSFGFKRGVPIDADMVYDVRMLPNPHWEPTLRALTGLDQGVIEFLEQQPQVAAMIHDISAFLGRWLPEFQNNNRSYVTIAIGCTGGQHRSVYITERLAEYFGQHYKNVKARHRELPRTEL